MCMLQFARREKKVGDAESKGEKGDGLGINARVLIRRKLTGPSLLSGIKLCKSSLSSSLRLASMLRRHMKVKPLSPYPWVSSSSLL